MKDEITANLWCPPCRDVTGHKLNTCIECGKVNRPPNSASLEASERGKISSMVNKRLRDRACKYWPTRREIKKAS